MLITLCKAFVRPYQGYGSIIYGEAYNEIFHQKLEAIQYNDCLSLSRAIRGLWREKCYHELSLESLKCWHWYRKNCLFYKIFIENKHIYLFNLIPTKYSNYNTKNTVKITLFHTKHNFFKKTFSSTIIEWNKLDPNFLSVSSLGVFKKNLSKFIRLSPSCVFNYHNWKGTKYLIILCFGLSHLRKHKLKHIFKETRIQFVYVALMSKQIRIYFFYLFIFFAAPCFSI